MFLNPKYIADQKGKFTRVEGAEEMGMESNDRQKGTNLECNSDGLGSGNILLHTPKAFRAQTRSTSQVLSKWMNNQQKSGVGFVGAQYPLYF